MWLFISFDSIVQSRTNLINFLPQKSKVWSAPLNIIVSAPADHFIWLMDSIKSEILLRVYSQYELRVGCVVSAWIFWYRIHRVIGLQERFIKNVLNPTKVHFLNSRNISTQNSTDILSKAKVCPIYDRQWGQFFLKLHFCDFTKYL